MRDTEQRTESAWKGLAAGLVGGLVATWAMTRFQTFLSELDTRDEKEKEGEGDDATIRAASAVSEAFGHPLQEDEKKAAGTGVHYGFGTFMGGAYGVATELAPAVAVGRGFPFGTALWLGADEVAVPALGLSKAPSEIPLARHAGALAMHLVYGAILEVVRRGVRRALD
jgi:uncharacterized membrane protein YagU involved in acid resistance